MEVVGIVDGEGLVIQIVPLASIRRVEARKGCTALVLNDDAAILVKENIKSTQQVLVSSGLDRQLTVHELEWVFR